MVVGLRTCGGVLFGQGAQLLSGSAQQEEQEDKRDEEIGDEVNGEVEEVTVRVKHEDDDGVNEDSNSNHSVRASIKEDSHRTTTPTDNKKERLRKRMIFNA